ncbi:hypothetical protein ASG76_01950 [Nocardioides sp. Soil774]|uniref:hypothetical protein n=1 Tax=Nocardioides sp. Soil774 TaxID=1736408 RepID=UPI0006FA4C8D|nr:hypothetical protein [Nocardioides sp. Soil774]KRE97502.1 hypothetical protein ASG76_01950 [Nocardioides sp. Soil774]
MTIEEIFRRIVRGHVVLILLCCVLPVGAALVVNATRPTEYVARVRLQVTSSAPASTTEAEALSSRVLALASTPSLVRQALKSEGLDGDAEKIAAEDVTAERLGESPVVQLAVRQPTSASAADLVGALATQVTEFMNQATRSRYDALLTDTERRLTAAGFRRDTLTGQLQETTGPQARELLRIELASNQQTVEQLSQQRLSLLLADAERDDVVLIDADAPDVDVVASGLVPRAALALLFGLVLGLSLAVLVETLRPRIAGVRALARSLDAPVLGTVTDGSAPLSAAMTVAARRQGVETLVLVGMDDRDDKAVRELLEEMPKGRLSHSSASAALSRELATMEQEGGGGRAGKAGPAPRPPSQSAPVLSHQVRFTDVHGLTDSEEPTAGVVVVTHGTALQREMDSLDDLRQARRWPVVGIVEVPRRPIRGDRQ